MILKENFSPDQICVEVVWFNRPRIEHVTLYLKKIFGSPFNFVLAVKVRMRPTLKTYQSTLSQESSKCCHQPAQNLHSHLTNCIWCSPRFFLGNQEVQLFSHTNTAGFLLCPKECGKFDICRLPNHLELHLHHRYPGRATHSTNKKTRKSKIQIHWSESFLVAVSGNSKPASANTCRLPRKKWIGKCLVWDT